MAHWQAEWNLPKIKFAARTAGRSTVVDLGDFRPPTVSRTAAARGCTRRVGSNLTMAEAKRSRINAFGIEDEGETGLSTSEFAWSA